MIVSATLLKDLQKRVTLLEEDLRRRCDADPQVNAPLQAQYAAARESKRTAETFNAWRDEQITQIAVAWVLACVFVRFLEDNQPLDTPFLAGPDAARLNRARDEQELFFKHHPTASERDYLLHVFEVVGQLPGMGEFFDRRHNPLWLAGPTGDTLAGLLDFWRRTNPDTGALAHVFTDPDWNTRFLGDLYQDLSEFARKRYALLQTPEFVEQFILDRTLTPAIETFGYQVVRMIDPTCGSGHFCLGGFHRLFRLWQQGNPGENPRVLAQRALDGVYGVDLNPYAVAIARFRLLLAALKVSGINKLKNAPDFRLHLASGDSLLHGRRFREHESFTAGPQVTFNTEDIFRDEFKHHYEVEDAEALHRILGRQYHVVVGNPPYITVKDKALNQLYRDRFDSCHQKFSLAAPFMERFFDLAIRGEPPMKWDPFASQREAPREPKPEPREPKPAGFVGMITSNSFMKREFGSKLIEECIQRWDLTHVIDTSGTYIPGHGTPTVILFGKHQPPVAATIRTVMGIKGEPATPEDPARGLVWTAILRQVDQPGSESDFVSVADSARETFHKHPWSIGGGGAAELKEELDATCSRTLGQIVDQLRGKPNIGITAFTLEDDAFIQPEHVLRRHRLGTDSIRTMVEGDTLRDWLMDENDCVIWPYDAAFEPISDNTDHPALRLLWFTKTNLANNFLFGRQTKVAAGLRWYEFGRLTAHKLRTPLSLCWGEVATHNHFVLDRGGKVFKNSTQVIKLKPHATEDDHLVLLGLLNSSTACFWMKQVCQPKGTVTGDISSEKGRPEANRYSFNATAIAKFPVPDLTTDLARRVGLLAKKLEATAQRLSDLAPRSVLRRWFGAGDNSTSLTSTLQASAFNYTQTRACAVLLQEELDWAVYEVYGVVDKVLSVDNSEVPTTAGMIPESRPFQWEDETPPLPIPPALEERFHDRRALIKATRLQLIENEVCKRLWLGRQGVYGSAPSTYDDRCIVALRTWLIERLEGYFFEGARVCRLEDGFSPAAHGFRAATQPALVSTNQLAELVQADAAFLKVAEVHVGTAGFSVPKLVRELVEAESVPFLPFQRYRESGLRKRQDWERTWELQRKEDEFDVQIEPLVKEVEDVVKKLSKNAESPEAPKWKARKEELGEDIRALKDDKAREVGVIPVPPKYASADFKSSTFWRLRGKLDVPKERWVSYPGAEPEGDPSPVIAWAGWNHLQQAQALAEYYLTAKDTWGWPSERLTLLLAGLADLLPWLKQWHNGLNPEYGTGLGDYFAGFLDEECRKNGTTVQAVSQMTMGRE